MWTGTLPTRRPRTTKPPTTTTTGKTAVAFNIWVCYQNNVNISWVLPYLLFIYLILHFLKSGGTKDQFRWVKAHGINHYWKASNVKQNIFYSLDKNSRHMWHWKWAWWEVITVHFLDQWEVMISHNSSVMWHFLDQWEVITVQEIYIVMWQF